ncbi:hypothetical protein BCR33DRAFT_725177 [Rhizoclosmatium globosum]|uniref:Uncharacterized protein n=1 Tax=Rhizoclosmatium globosum TaxID=329046 RepID=A0A1Y2B185_9FUNG|nr:hypothetical protein BCR33DRAFT_725177 [Rhizoclosmatium globosum]|eukprot:ORY28247.1 hypothetical protein BCR33DRAFT_725177 [Rhizoclosmatium globosum]
MKHRPSTQPVQFSNLLRQQNAASTISPNMAHVAVALLHSRPRIMSSANVQLQLEPT